MQTVFRATRRKSKSKKRRLQSDTQSDPGPDRDSPARHCYDLQQPPVPRSPDIHFLDPYNILPTAGAKDLDQVAQWFFYSQLDNSSGSWIGSAKINWGTRFWDFARTSDVVFHLLMLMVVYKQVRLDGQTISRLKSYHLYKHHVISEVRRELHEDSEKTKASTAIAICGLAMFALRERDYPAINMHMRVVRSVCDKTHIEETEWLYITWIDLLMASILLRPPMLPYTTSSAIVTAGVALRQGSEEARRLAARNVRGLPQSPLLNSQTAFELFTSLHEVQLFATQRHTATSVPLAAMYDLVFHICTLHSDAMAAEDSLIEVILIAAQLDAWSAARFWAPLHEDGPKTMLTRLAELLQSQFDEPGAHSQAMGKSVMVWILFTACSWSSIYLPDMVSTFATHLRSTARRWNLTKKKDLQTLLGQWPIPRQSGMYDIDRIWRMLQIAAPKRWVKVEEDSIVASNSDTSSVQANRFVGIFEFHVHGDV